MTCLPSEDAGGPGFPQGAGMGWGGRGEGWGCGGRGGHAGTPTPTPQQEAAPAWAAGWELSSTEPAESSRAWPAGGLRGVGLCPVPAPGVEASVGGQAWDGGSLLLLQATAQVGEGALCVQSEHDQGRGLCSTLPRETPGGGGPHAPSLTVKPAQEWPWTHAQLGTQVASAVKGA